MAIIPDFGVLVDDFSKTKVMKTFALDKAKNAVEFAKGIRVPFRPFAGVMGVAPDTDEMLNTGPPRANGGNLDNPDLISSSSIRSLRDSSALPDLFSINRSVHSCRTE
jgi:acetamidase/formamidase